MSPFRKQYIKGGNSLISLDKYIEKRLKEEKKNLLDLENKDMNLQDCINYVFDYFNTYITIDEAQKMKIENDEKIEKYVWQIKEYSSTVQNWLVDIYSKYNKKMNQQIPKLLRDMDLFLVYNSPTEFRKQSYKCYSKLIKSYPFLENNIDQLYDFIIDQHRIWSNNYYLTDENRVSFNDKIDNYILNHS